MARRTLQIFCFQDCCSLIAQVKYQGQTLYTRILDLKPFIDRCWHHCVALDIDLSWNIIHFAQFLLNALWAARTDNLKFRTDLQDQVLDGWSATQWMIVYKGRLLKKSSTRKSKLVLSMLVTTWLSNIAFHLLQIWLQTLVEIDSESCQTLFPSVCAPPSEVNVLLYSHLSWLPFLGQVVVLDWLWKATTSCQSAQFHRKFHFTWKKSDLSRPDIYKTLKLFWLSNWVSVARVIARFPQASL